MRVLSIRNLQERPSLEEESSDPGKELSVKVLWLYSNENIQFDPGMVATLGCCGRCMYRIDHGRVLQRIPVRRIIVQARSPSS